MASAPPTSQLVQWLQRHARVFWLAAIFLLVGGHLTHAYVDSREPSCQSQHAEEEHPHSDSGESESTESHHCCHSHAPANSVVSDAARFRTPHFVTGTLPVTSDSVPEPPVREIDYPPQLS